MPSTSKPGAVVFAKGLERLARFYEQLLSLPVTHSERDHVVLDTAIALEAVIASDKLHIAFAQEGRFVFVAL